MKFFRLLFIVLLVLISCQKKKISDNHDRVTIDDVTKVIKTLSSDEMEGRASFTKGIDKAADFITAEFRKRGAKPFRGSYKHNFSIYELSPLKKHLIINGKSKGKNKYFVRAHSETVKHGTPKGLEILSVLTSDELRTFVSSLQSIKKKTVVFVSPSLKSHFARLENYLTGKLKATSLKNDFFILVILSDPQSIKSIDLEYKNKVTEKRLTNVIAQIDGTHKDEYVLFSAHYDHLGINPRSEGGDTIFNGANDDASGVTAVLSLAKKFASAPKPERSLLFAAFTAEEIGGYGSQHFSQQLNPDEIVAMFNIEMIGKPSSQGPNKCWITGFNVSNFGRILQKAVEGTKYTFYEDPYPEQNLFYRSDNETFARLGVPAHTLSTTPIDVDKDYHKVSDEFSTLDLKHINNTINAIFLAAQTIVNREQTPTRIETSKVK